MRKFGIAAFVAAIPGTKPAVAINTHNGWNRTTSAFTFGCAPGVASVYGQTVTIPKFRNSIGVFAFWFANIGGQGSMVARGEIYRWDPVNRTAIGPAVWESEPRKIAYADSAFHRVLFKPYVPATPGAQ